jgi:uncharacterized Fe-S center protein
VKSTVYSYPLSPSATYDDLVRATDRLFAASGFGNLFQPEESVAVKLHFGEGDNPTYLKAPIARALIARIKAAGGRPFLTDSNTLYRGSRTNAIDHLALAYAHGFTPDGVGAPVIIADGLLGTDHVAVPIQGKHYQEVPVSAAGHHARALIAITHVTGHIAAGFAGSIKNIAMGLSSRAGKLSQHSDMLPDVSETRCVACGTCAERCPTEAITVKETAEIDEKKCIGCGECLAVCPNDAITFSWSESSEGLQEKMAEHALAVVSRKPGRIGFLNYIYDVTKGCDCFDTPQEPVLKSLAVLASTDCVAVDKASVDLMNEHTRGDFFRKLYRQIHYDVQFRHGESIGLGSTEYDLVAVS